MPKISIVVPIYNAEKYLKKCIKSLINQTLKDIEIILINDGSTDSSESIIKKFEDKRIKYYKNPNQGIGKTRNFGIEKATGKYIMFIDSDDYISENMCKKMYLRSEKDDLDITICDFYKDIEGKLEPVYIPDFSNTTLDDNPKLLLNVNLAPWNKLYKLELIRSNKIKFEENLKYEDAPFVIECLSKAKQIGKLNKCLCYYCIHGNSETTIRDERIFHILQIIDKIRNKIKNNKKQNTYLNDLTIRMITNYTIQQRYQKNKKLRNKFIDESFEYLKKEVPDYRDNKYYKSRGFFKRIIEKNKYLTKMYCNLYNVKNK